MKLIHAHTLDQVNWSDSPIAQSCKKIWSAVMKNGARHYIKNVDCETKLLTDGDLFLPVVIPNPKYPNSYICSPYGQYVDYGYREVDIELGERPLVNALSKSAIKVFEKCAPRKHFDKVVFVNNWLVSTNLYPKQISAEQFTKITQLLTKKYPNRAIVFRSISTVLNRDLIPKMEKVGYEKVLSRQIYIVDPKEGIYKKKSAFKKDVKLQRKRTTYQWKGVEDYNEKIWKEVKQLYDQLYIQKYSKINPQFTSAFFRESIQEHWLRYSFLKKEDQIHACLGYLHRNGIMTTPVIGYDFNLPQKEGMYRLIALRITQEGLRNQLIIHRSSGASHFKKLRGAQASSEYNLVYTKHLSKARKLAWQILQKMTKYIATPILNKYEL